MRNLRTINLSVGIFFGLEGTLFFIICLITISRIKLYFQNFYQAHRCTLYLAMYGLSLPLILHSILDLMSLNLGYAKFKYDNITLYNITIFIFGDVIPVGFQFSSLIFGFIRK